jgi:hypothetical protein
MVRSTRRRIGGSAANLRLISHREFAGLSEDEQAFYDPECFHKRLPENVGTRRVAARRSAAAERNASAASRLARIHNDPSIVISQQELRDLLTAEERADWVLNHSEGPQYNRTNFYRRKRASNSINWQAEHGPADKTFTDAEYRRMSPRVQALLKKVSVQVGLQEFAMLWRRRTAANSVAEREGTLEWKVDNNPNIMLYVAEYNQLSPRQRALGWVKTEVQSGYQETTTMYRRRVAKNDTRDSIAEKKARQTQILAGGQQKRLGWSSGDAGVPQYGVLNDRDSYIQLTAAKYEEYTRLGREIAELERAL